MQSIRFTEPLTGSFFLFTDEKRQHGGAHAECRLSAPRGHRITVNGLLCTEQKGEYRVTVPLPKQGHQLLLAEDSTDGSRAICEVYRVDLPQKVYRVSVDDNIWFLQDIAQNQAHYQSIFQNPYLAMYRRLHEEYGTKFHFNIYFTCPEHGGFSLPSLSDRFRAEWQSVNDWMTLSFHARADLPNWPYSHAGYQEVYADCRAVMDEIERFAGYRGYVTTLHFAEATKDGIRALFDCGVRALLGDFSRDENGKGKLCYFASEEEFEAVRRRCFRRDPDTGMIFFACDTVLNTMPPDKIRAELSQFAVTYPDRAFVDLLIHEQYFYPDYENHLPDYEARLRTGIEWCRDRGYVPALVKDIIKPESLESNHAC